MPAWQVRLGSTSKYVAVEVRRPFDQAKAMCEFYEASLASVDSAAEQSFVVAMLSRSVRTHSPQ